MFALDTAGLTVFRRKTEAFSRRGRPGCSLKANSAFPGGGRGTTKWGMRRSNKIQFFERSEKIFQKITSPRNPH